MSLWKSWASRENFRSVTGCDDEDAYWAFEAFLWILCGFIASAIATVVGVGYVLYKLWTQIALEVGYREKFGAGWKTEFERYHGSLFQAHLRLAVVFFCLIALLVIFGWIGRRFYRIHKLKKLGPLPRSVSENS